MINHAPPAGKPPSAEHVCDPEVCGITRDPGCPVWDEIRREEEERQRQWEAHRRQDRIKEFARRHEMTVEELREMFADLVSAEPVRSVVAATCSQTIAEDTPDVLDALGVVRRGVRS